MGGQSVGQQEILGSMGAWKSLLSSSACGLSSEMIYFILYPLIFTWQYPTTTALS